MSCKKQIINRFLSLRLLRLMFFFKIYSDNDPENVKTLRQNCFTDPLGSITTVDGGRHAESFPKHHRSSSIS